MSENLKDLITSARKEAKRLWEAYERVPPSSIDKQILWNSASRASSRAMKLEQRLHDARTN